jgi:hypothetical protein
LTGNKNVFRTYKPQTSKKISRKPKSLSDEQFVSGSPAPVHPTLQMQSLIGNHATQRLIQRMPTHGVIIATLGQPKAHKTVFGKVIKKNSTRYRRVLDAVKAYDNYLGNTVLGANKGEIQAQFVAASALLTTVQTSMAVYDGETDDKAVYFASKKGEVEAEKTKLATSMIHVVNNPVNYANFGSAPRPKFGMVLRPGTTPILKERDKIVGGGDKGGTNEVSQYRGATPGYFKATKNTLYNPEDGLEPIKGETPDQREGRANDKMGEMLGTLRAELGPEKGLEKYQALDNELTFGVKTAGINSQDARMAKRDVATTRLNQLLGANIIAKAQLSIQENGDGKKVEGSIMEKAVGKSLNTMAAEEGFHDAAAGEAKDASKPQQVSLQDPKLMQMLSKLQLIDQLAFQIDRNTGNYFIQTDAAGNVIGLTGIDNDFSFGNRTELDKKTNTLPALSKYVDEEMATAIINLEPDVLKVAMADLLDEQEIAALITRLKTMQDFLRPLQARGELLKPGQWDAAMAKKLLDEKVGKAASYNYYQTLVKARTELAPKKPVVKAPPAH